MLSQNGLDSQYLYDLLKRLCKYYKYKAAHSFHLSVNGYSDNLLERLYCITLLFRLSTRYTRIRNTKRVPLFKH